MIALLQRVTKATVYPKGNIEQKSEISSGLLVLVGVDQDDTVVDVEKISSKLSKIRVFSDADGKMNLDIHQVHQEILLVSQFTLISDTSGGNRPSFAKAAKGEKALHLFNELKHDLEVQLVSVKTGFFGEYMELDLKLDGPVTIYLDSKKL